VKRYMPYLRALALTFFLCAGLITCYTNPISGRRELSLVPADQEIQLGAQAFSDVKKQTPVSTDPNANAAVQRVGHRIANAVTLPNAQWEFVAFQSDQVNAFCLPGGKVGVYTALLPITQNDAGLATVIGHETGHAVARHGGERMSEQLLIQFGGLSLAMALQNKPKQTQDLALTAYGIGAAIGYELPFSRKQESEADYMGLIFMARAGYDPMEAVSFWQRFKAWGDKQGNRPPEFLSTHPLDSRRIKDLQKHMPEAQKEYRSRGGK
jgi:predicted Zn-dependent protease